MIKFNFELDVRTKDKNLVFNMYKKSNTRVSFMPFIGMTVHTYYGDGFHIESEVNSIQLSILSHSNFQLYISLLFVEGDCKIDNSNNVIKALEKEGWIKTWEDKVARKK